MNNQDRVVNLGGFWLPRQSSTLAPDVDMGWDVAYWLSVFFFVGIVGAMAYLVMRYRRKSDNDVTSKVDHSLPIEIIWTTIPSIMCIGLFLVGFKGYINAHVIPADAYEIQVTAQKWLWTFTYPNGTTTPGEIRVPKGRPIKLVMSSKDVLHSFFVPEFRTKMDVIPGSYTSLWFEATDLGEKVVFCTEYCGTDHSNMLAKMIVMEEKDFKAWLETGGEDKDTPPAKAGEKLFASMACNSCHSLDGTPKIGPSMKGVFGRQEELVDGTKVTVDENYIRESIVNPTAKVVKGFAPVMPPFKGVLKDKQIDAIIAYLKEQK